MDFSTSKYLSAIEILTSQGKFYINLGLERVQKVLGLLENPQKELKFIHVAGTNGKGSVCAMLSAILKEGKSRNKFKVGLFTSPHVYDYTERIKINDVEIEKEVFAEKIIKVVEIADKNEIHLTEFEIITVVALDYFAENNVDIVILETGLGGRLDATNVIEKNLCSIITNIDFDHTDRLGDTIEKIATEKAGIIKQNCPVIISPKNVGFEVVKKIALIQNSKIVEIQEASILLQEKLALQGAYQRENLTLVLGAVDVLNTNGFAISKEMIEAGLGKVKHPCRFEFLAKENLIIDGAHNPNGAKALRESLNEKFPNQSFKFIFGCLNNKEYSVMMKNLFSAKDEIYFYQFDNPNSCSYAELASVCEFESKSFESFINDKKTLTVICGSFYMIKDLLNKMGIK